MLPATEIFRAAPMSGPLPSNGPGKRAICAGPGNPPVIVDGTGDLKKAARDIISGGAYDNNLLCIGEKQVFVLEQFADKFIEGLKAANIQLDRRQLSEIAIADAVAFTGLIKQAQDALKAKAGAAAKA